MRNKRHEKRGWEVKRKGGWVGKMSEEMRGAVRRLGKRRIRSCRRLKTERRERKKRIKW